MTTPILALIPFAATTPKAGNPRDDCGRIVARIFRIMVMAALAFPVFPRAQETLETQPAAPEVLIINSYSPGYEWSNDQLTGILSVFKKRFPNFEPVIQYLDFRRFTYDEREKWLLDDAAHKSRIRKPELIITVDNAAFDFALKYRDHFGSEVPLVFSGLNRFTPDMIAGQPNITGVSEESDFSGTFELVKSLRPKASRVLVICTETWSSSESRTAFEALMPRYADRYTFEFYDRWTNAELIDRVATLPDDWVGLILDVTRDSTGHNNYKDAVFTHQLATRTRVPIFLTSRPPGDNDWSHYEWDGIGGGLIVAELHGAKVGELALRVLDGEDADSIPVVRHSPERLEVDYRQMQRFGLSLDLLPPGTSVINAPVTFYQVNRSRLIMVGVVVVLLVGVIILLSLNILRRRRAERALHKAEEQLRSSQKLEAIGLLAGGVAHDFNNILQIIQGHAEFLRMEFAAASSQSENVNIIQNAAKRASQLTRQLLAFSRKQPLQREPIDPNALVTEMVTMLRRVLGEHIEVVVSPLPRPTTLIADKGQLEQVLLNLLLNSRDAMPSGGRVVIELGQTFLQNASQNGEADLTPGSYLVLKVTDNGSGMPVEVLEHLFEPFFTTKALGKGTGMGLAVVYGIVRQHGGIVWAESERGKGSTFTIMLPLTGTETAPAPVPVAIEPPPGQGTILLAEDDAQVRGVAERVLSRNGFRVISAVDGQEAQILIEKHHSEIRLAVLDVIMPKRNGREVFEYIQAEHPTIPVLFCSGYGADMLPPESAPDAGRALLSKPYTPHQLLTQVHRLMKR